MAQTPYRKFPESHVLSQGAAPQDMSSSTVTSNYNSAQYGQGLHFKMNKGSWATASGVITMLQAQDNAGLNAKALRMPEVFVKANVDAVRTLVDTSGTDSYALTDDDNQSVEVDVHARDLDADGGFTHVAMVVTGVGAGGHLGNIEVIAHDMRYQSRVEDQPDIRA